MTVNRIKLTATLTLLVAIFMAGLSATSAQAQDDQEYKRAYNAGLEAYKAKNIDQAYSDWERTVDLAKTAGDNDIANKANNYLAQLDYRRGGGLLKTEDFEGAISHFDKGIARNANFAKNYYGKGLALKKLDRIDDAMAMYQQAIEVGNANRDRKTASTAEKAIRDYYIFVASSALGKQSPSGRDADNALGAIESLTQFVELDADGFYYQAVAHNVKGDHSTAIDLSKQALDLHKGSRADKSKIYYTLGEAYMYSGDNASAKDAFSNCIGNWAASAKHYMETLD